MRNALVVGINYYENTDSLSGCVNDALAIKDLLDFHGDEKGRQNFDDVKPIAGLDTSVTRSQLIDEVEKLFASKADLALLYFAGHGELVSSGGYLLTSEVTRADEGVPVSMIINMANESDIRNKIIILDSCKSGIAGNPPGSDKASLSEGLTILTASTESQEAMEEDGQGVFTSLLIDALNGSAADLVGNITPGSIYAHIDQSMGNYGQRPIFKTNVTNFVSLRMIEPPIWPKTLRKLKDYFPEEGFEFRLDPTFEEDQKGRSSEAPAPVPENVEIYKVLQTFNRHGLVVPVGADHMYYAAMNSKSCKLSLQGEYYRKLAVANRIK